MPRQVPFFYRLVDFTSAVFMVSAGNEQHQQNFCFFFTVYRGWKYPAIAGSGPGINPYGNGENRAATALDELQVLPYQWTSSNGSKYSAGQ